MNTKETLENKARQSKTCPVCGSSKSFTDETTEGAIVCWGSCWKGAGGLKWTKKTTEQWLSDNIIKLR